MLFDCGFGCALFCADLQTPLVMRGDKFVHVKNDLHYFGAVASVHYTVELSFKGDLLLLRKCCEFADNSIGANKPCVELRFARKKLLFQVRHQITFVGKCDLKQGLLKCSHLVCHFSSQIFISLRKVLL